MAEVPQKSLERYDVLDRIAVGGMAEVFLAKAYGAHGFEKTLAIKRILPELARDPEFEERFIAEAKLAVKLSHTNVVQVFDFGRFAGSLFIAMEYVDGLDLAAMLRRFKERHERVPLPAAFQIAIELSRGLDFAHSHGVVHRDVSPSNILLSKAGEVKIADFGIAVAAQPGKVVAAGGRRKVMGKWRYMSPEQARGEPLDTRSDMFSAAAVMFELFTGEKLFPGDEADDIIRNIHEMPIPKMASIRRGLPARLDDILQQALARRPQDRPLRPAVLLRALTELTYESSIVTTALDVAEAVGYVVDLSTPTGKRLDDIIRAQLANVAEASAARQTALGERRTGSATAPPPSTATSSIVTGASIDAGATGDRRTAEGSAPHDLRDLRDTEHLTAVTVARRKRRTGAEEAIDDRGGAGRAVVDHDAADDDDAPLPPPIEGVPVLMARIDSDGISRLELDETTVSVAPWELGGSAPPDMPPRLKATAASGSIPPTPISGLGLRATSQSSASSTALLAAMPAAPPARRGAVLAMVGLAALIAGGGVFLLTRRSGDAVDAARLPPVTPAALIDAAAARPVVAASILIVETVPAGAHGTAGGLAFGPTPATLEVPPGAAPLRVELAGYEPYLDDGVRVEPGQTLRLHLTLTVARARLAIESEPPDAEVSLDGVELGRTPLTVRDLTPHKGARLRFVHAGFVPLTVPVELIAGEEVRVFRALKPAPTPLGTITLDVADSWGEVFENGKKIGQAGLGAKPLALPAGKHRLKVSNPETGKSATIDVEVRADENRPYTVSLQ